MTAPTPTPDLPIRGTPMYRLIAEKMSASGAEPADPIEYILARRATTPPTPYNKIAHEIKDATGEYITQELVRRWYLHATEDREHAA